MEINVLEQIKRFQDFIDGNYYKSLLENARKGDRFLIIDFIELSKYDPDLATQLLDAPEETIKAVEKAIEQFDIEGISRFRIRFHNLPQGQHTKIRDIRSKHISRLVYVEGLIRQKSDVRPQVTSAKFECPACGNIINVLQLEGTFKEPARCGCGRKGKFVEIGKELVDAQGIVMEEVSENLEGGEQPKRISVLLTDDLVSPISEKRTAPGSKVGIIGIVKEVPIISRTGAKSTKFDLMIEANYVKPTQDTFYEVMVSDEEEKQILEIANDPRGYEKLINSIAPSIYGYEKIKEALLLQLMGGVRKVRADNVISRGDCHILLVGDPGSGKSALLKRITTFAPKGRYVSGKGISGAGITAAVVRDEFLKGWALEAGAMVLSSDGVVCVDELDKMSNEDRAAMHESLENQSYHYNTEIMLSDGSTFKIGKFVEELIDNNRDEVIFGKNCEILPVNNVELLTTDFEKIFPTKATMVSKHKAPDYFVKITYSNGRSIMVTPEHPVYVFYNGKISETPAEQVKQGLLAPAPRKLPTKSKNVEFIPSGLNHFNNKEIEFPSSLNNGLARLLGYITTEGYAYFSTQNRYAEVGISNTNPFIIDEMSLLFKETFKTTVNINVQFANSRSKAKKDIATVRICSKPFYNYIFSNFRGSANGAKNKYINNSLRCADKEFQLEFLRTAFKGDGFVDSRRFGYSTSSLELAKGYQDLLLQNNIGSRIDTEKRNSTEYYKVAITGTEGAGLFLNNIAEEDDHRIKRLSEFYNASKNKKNERDILPREILIEVNLLLKSFNLSDGYFINNINRGFNAHKDVVLGYIRKIEDKLKECDKAVQLNNPKKLRRLLNIEVNFLARNVNVSAGTIYNIEKKNNSARYHELVRTIKKLGNEKIQFTKSKVNYILKLINSEIRFLYVKKVEKIKNDGMEWVYDVTVEPTRTFISEGLVLHNTISISKANIQATLIARTTVLAAANPKFGRFDPYAIIADQIDLPPTLINRFDLIFPIKDLPEETRDEKMAKHILTLHQSPEVNEPEVSTELLRKYVAYARQKVSPKLTDGALEEIKDFYLKMRKGGGEGGIRSVPISARQLEALVRLSEASAKARLDDRVTRKDAKKAIELLDYCLMQVGFDKETGKVDIDRIATGVGASQRSHIMVLRDIIIELESKLGKSVPMEDVMAEAKSRGLDEDKVEEALERLKRSGDVYEPKRGHVSKLP
ncbi:MCM family protein [Candidatus Woesearchaeota archaeon]|nr:MCM family protein [Candidatus Woesearchaeota archaeon]